MTILFSVLYQILAQEVTPSPSLGTFNLFLILSSHNWKFYCCIIPAYNLKKSFIVILIFFCLHLDACDLPIVSGCFANFERWHFNSATGRCDRFIYGGCDGNANNFFTLRDCQLFARRFMRNRPSRSAAGTWSPKGQGVPRAIQLLPRDGQRARYGWGAQK